ncbi:MAG: FUN14 domain-containing protein [Candidatus Babeliales bacterium]
MVSPETQSTVKGWLESLKDILHLDELAQKLNISVDTLGQTLLFFGIGLITGFLYKRIGRQFIYAVLISVVALSILSYFDLVTVHTDNFKQLFGFSTHDTVGNVFEMFGAWVKEHVAQVIAGILGVWLGSKIG